MLYELLFVIFFEFENSCLDFHFAIQSTLLRFSHSILARMITGQIPLRKDKDGNLFLDRDPTIFRYILDFLRSSKVWSYMLVKLFFKNV